MNTGKNYSKTMRALFVLFLVIVAGSQVRSSKAQTPQTDNPDFTLRSSESHWPEGFNPGNADLFVHNEVVIQASCSKAWGHLVRASAWPRWYANSHDVVLLNSGDGRLHADTRFSWETFGVHVQSRVHEFVPNSRIGWFGDGTGVKAYHTFLLEQVSGSCHIVTEEVVKGPAAIELRKNNRQGMHEGHALWLASLKTTSEK